MSKHTSLAVQVVLVICSTIIGNSAPVLSGILFGCALGFGAGVIMTVRHKKKGNQ